MYKKILKCQDPIVVMMDLKFKNQFHLIFKRLKSFVTQNTQRESPYAIKHKGYFVLRLVFAANKSFKVFNKLNCHNAVVNSFMLFFSGNTDKVSKCIQGIVT